MAGIATDLATVPPERVIGELIGGEPGPTLIVMTLIHGNEPAGYLAARRLLERLRVQKLGLRGELVVLAGNRTAVEQNTRFVDEDLNRHWTRRSVAAASEPHSGEAAEARQRREVTDEVARIVRRARGPIHFLDLHTSSASGPPFLTVGDTLRNRRFARGFPLPLLLGLEEQVDGSLLEYLNNHGFITMGVEAGRHDADESVDHHEAVLWLALRAAGMIEAPRGLLAPFRQLLARAVRGLPHVVEVRHRHALHSGSRFRMEPDFVNFLPVSAGDLLAHDDGRPVRAVESGRMLLPLYQGKGDDGFFLGREVSRVWLGLSATLRRLGLVRLIHLLPGISRHPEKGEILVVDTRVARWYPLELFHLAGYRKLRRVGRVLLVSRRRHDLAPPDRVVFPEATSGD